MVALCWWRCATTPAGGSGRSSVLGLEVAPQTVAPQTVAPQTVAPQTVAPQIVAP